MFDQNRQELGFRSLREIIVALRLFCMLHAPEAYVVWCFKSLHEKVCTCYYL